MFKTSRLQTISDGAVSISKQFNRNVADSCDGRCVFVADVRDDSVKSSAVGRELITSAS